MADTGPPAAVPADDHLEADVSVDVSVSGRGRQLIGLGPSELGD